MPLLASKILRPIPHRSYFELMLSSLLYKIVFCYSTKYYNFKSYLSDMRKSPILARCLTAILSIALFSVLNAHYSAVHDDFDGSGTISSWFGDDCQMNPNVSNPYSNSDNASATVLRYEDYGGPYGNIRFTNDVNYNMSTGTTFSMKVYVPSDGIRAMHRISFR